MEQLNKMKLVNLRKRMEKYDCEYSKRIIEVINECYEEECEKVDCNLRKKKAEYQLEYQWQDVVCEDCGLATKRSYIYEHRKFHCPYKIEKKIEIKKEPKQKAKITLEEDNELNELL